MVLCRGAQLLLQLIPLPGQRWQGGGIGPEQFPPQIQRWIEQHAAVLQQSWTLPELSAADALAAIQPDQIR